MTIHDTHMEWVGKLKERGETVLQPKYGKPMGTINGYVKTQVPPTNAGAIFEDKNGMFGLFEDMGTVHITGIKWEDLGLCDARCWYEWMDPESYQPKAKDVFESRRDMTLSIMIKKKYLAEKIEEQQRTGSFIERRTYKPYWRSRIGSPGSWSKLRKSKAVFLCGRYAFYADLQGISLDSTPAGIEDAVTSSLCYNITCKFPPDELKALETFYQSSMESEL